LLVLVGLKMIAPFASREAVQHVGMNLMLVRCMCIEMDV
jgi:hypothetical protein